jgi:hypothetical protein
VDLPGILMFVKNALVFLLFLLIVSLPGLILAGIVWKACEGIKSSLTRVAIAAVPLAFGVAPYFYAHGVVPVYFLLFLDPWHLPNAALSIAITWFIVFGIAGFIFCKRGSGTRQSNSTVDSDARNDAARGSH